MDMRDAFPGSNLKAEDLKKHGRKGLVVTINTVEMVDLNDGSRKPLMSFTDEDKTMFLNKTNTNTLIELYGPESDEWHGKQITLIADKTDFQGKRVDCIRVDAEEPIPF